MRAVTIGASRAHAVTVTTAVPEAHSHIVMVLGAHTVILPQFLPPLSTQVTRSQSLSWKHTACHNHTVLKHTHSHDVTITVSGAHMVPRPQSLSPEHTQSHVTVAGPQKPRQRMQLRQTHQSYPNSWSQPRSVRGRRQSQPNTCPLTPSPRGGRDSLTLCRDRAPSAHGPSLWSATEP